MYLLTSDVLYFEYNEYNELKELRILIMKNYLNAKDNPFKLI